MKLISDHLGQIIAALAAVAILITSVVFFKAPIGGFFSKIVDKETNIGEKIVANVEDVNLQYGETGGSGAGAVTMLDGAGQEYNTVANITPLSFRSSAPVDTLQEVKVNGVTVDSSNYDVTEGSTIITFKDSYAKSLPSGNNTIEIVSEGGTAKANFETTKTIPEGGIYTVNTEWTDEDGGYWKELSQSIVYTAGQEFPENPCSLDRFVYGDYEYRYSTAITLGWSVKALDLNKEQYGKILEYIYDKPLINMEYTFESCTKMKSIPKIPDTVVSLTGCFIGCTSLTDASNLVIPNSVQLMADTFQSCSNLEKAPVIPSSVTSLFRTFAGCTSLTGEIEINTNVNSSACSWCFGTTSKPIKIVGSCSEQTKAALAGTALDEFDEPIGNVTY